MLTCPHCHKKFVVPIDDTIEPMFTLAEAQSLIPMSDVALRQFLRRHQEIPKRYRRDHQMRRLRLLTASEVRYIRAHLVRTYVEGRSKLLALIDLPSMEETNFPTIDLTKAPPRKYRT